MEDKAYNLLTKIYTEMNNKFSEMNEQFKEITNKLEGKADKSDIVRLENELRS